MNKIPCVLIVEDSPTQAQQIAADLSAHKIEVYVAADGPEGLRLVDEHQPDLIVLDVNLPTMSGYQISRRLKRDPNTAHIQVVMFTEAESSEDTIEGLEAGADDYIPKDEFATDNLLTSLQVIGLIQG